MAAVVHYFLLATFMWFAMQAFHLCLQLAVGGKVDISHYVLRVSICSWGEHTSLFSTFCPGCVNDPIMILMSSFPGLPLVVVVVLLSVGRYGAQDINTGDTDETVTM